MSLVPTEVLAGKRVVDIATLMAGPWAAQYLGDFGADVIKVEQPGIGDHQRRWGSRKDGEPLFWKSISRNKRSITLDLHGGGVRRSVEARPASPGVELGV